MPELKEENKSAAARLREMREDSEKRSESTLKKMFEEGFVDEDTPADPLEDDPTDPLEDPPADPDEGPDPDPDEDPEPEPPEPREPEEEEEPELDEGEDEFDYDDPAEDEEGEEDEEEPDDPANESIAQQQARENGREVKRLKTELTERELELDRMRAERDEAQERLSDFEKVSIDPTTHPEFKETRAGILRDVDRVADRLPVSASPLRSRFGNYMNTYLDADQMAGEDRDGAMAKLKVGIARDLGGFETELQDFKDLDELDGEERDTANKIIDRVFDLLERQAPNTEKLMDLEGEIRDKSKTGRMEIGRKEYEKRVKSLRPVLDSIGNMEEDVVDAQPFAVPAIVTKLAKKDPKFKERLEVAEKDTVEVLFGPRPLTQKEIDTIEARGDDVGEFLAAREKKHADKVRKHAVMHVELLALRQLISKNFEEAAKRSRKESEEDDEAAALSSLGKRKRPRKSAAVPVKKPQGPARNRDLAIDKYFD